MPPKLRKTLHPSWPSQPPGAWQECFVGALAAPHTPRHGYPPGVQAASLPRGKLSYRFIASLPE
jgi:hypothetical protein